MGLLLVVALLAGSCGDSTSSDDPGDAFESSGSQSARVEEVRFTSDEFELVGDLHLPAADGPSPAIVIVHGDGPQTRSSTPGTQLLLDEFGAAGFAVLAWDKPGSGESVGEFDEGETLRQRAAILVAGIGLLADHVAIDGDRIGLWGLSQAGWVMPLALERTDDVASMVVVSGGGEDSIEQLAYQLSEDLRCQGIDPEQAELVEAYFPQVAKGPTYEHYVEAMEVLVEIEGWERFAGPEVRTEDEWQTWPAHIDAYFDPMTVIRETSIPVLAVFGEMDRYVDPIQGADANEAALREAGNPSSRIELIPEVGHTMQNQSTKCSSGGTTSSEYVRILGEWIAFLATDVDNSDTTS